jgi:hypothetical protein
MDLKKEVKEIIKWAQESEENKKKAINMATMVIGLLNSSKGNIDDNELDKLAGGLDKENNITGPICG